MEDVETIDTLTRAHAWRAEGLGVALCTVVSTWGSSPRPAGSHLAVDERGRFVGSVSGGCVEAEVVAVAREVIADGRVRLLSFGVQDEAAWAVGLACGGTIRVFVERLSTDAGWLQALLDDRAARREVVRATALDGGLDLLVRGAEDETVPAWLREAAREAAHADRSGPVPGPAEEVFLRVYSPSARLLVVGAVHVAQPLAAMAALAGLDVVVIDPRSAWASPARFPGVSLDPRWPGEAVAARAPDRRTAVVTLAHDPKLDDPALVAALASPAFYVGALGSRKSHARRLERLAVAGVAEADLARIRGPVGLPIGARSPAEIAVSILAEVIAALRTGR